MTKTLNYLLPLLLPLLLLVSCEEKEEPVIAPTNEPVNLTVSLKVPKIVLTRGVSDDPRNEEQSWTEAQLLTDGRELYHVTLFLIEETTGKLVGLRDIEYGSPHISDGVEEANNKDNDEDSYGANGFSTNGIVDVHAQKGAEVTFNFLYDYPRHGRCEKLRRGDFKLLVIANHTKRDNYGGLTDNAGIQMETLVDKIKSDFDIVKGNGVENFFSEYSDFFNFKIHAGTGGLCSKTNPQPLTLIQEIALNPGDNYVESELKRTYSRIRLGVMNNSSSVPLKVNNLSFSKNFAQQETYLFDDPDQPDRKYTGFTKMALDVDNTESLTAFSQNSIPKASDAIVFDGYILESHDDTNEGYYYTLDVEYEGKKYTSTPEITRTAQTVAEIRNAAVENVNEGDYFIIENTRSNKRLYQNSENYLYQGALTLDELETERNFTYLWKLIKVDSNNEENFYLMNASTQNWVGFPYDGKTKITASHEAFYQLDTYNGNTNILLESHNPNDKDNGTNKRYLNDYESAGAHIGGYGYDNNNKNDGGSRYRFYPAKISELPAQYTTPILLETVDPITAQVTQVESIKRNDFIDILVTVAYDEGNGNFKFVIVPWSDKRAEIEFN